MKYRTLLRKKKKKDFCISDVIHDESFVSFKYSFLRVIIAQKDYWLTNRSAIINLFKSISPLLISFRYLNLLFQTCNVQWWIFFEEDWNSMIIFQVNLSLKQKKKIEWNFYNYHESKFVKDKIHDWRGPPHFFTTFSIAFIIHAAGRNPIC